MSASLFVIEDEIHADLHGEFASLAEAIGELQRRASVPWNEPPNRAPCTGSGTCGREYVVVEYDQEWRELNRLSGLDVSASGVKWHLEPGDTGQ